MTATILTVVMVIALPAIAQQGVDVRIEGTVTDAETGVPLEKAQVLVMPGRRCCGSAHTTTSTDKDGVFHTLLGDRRPYSIRASSDGYVAFETLQTANCSPCKVDFRLHAEARVSGRVVDADTKEPLARVTAEAIQVSAPFAAYRALSDQDGKFSLEQMLPGVYYFRFTPVRSAVPLLGADPHEAAAREYAPQWWPDGGAARNATPFAIAAGTTFRMPDIWISPVARFQISGTVKPDGCVAGDAYSISIGEEKGRELKALRSEMVYCNGEYAFQSLNPGQYQISLRRKNDGEASSRAEVLVSDRDMRSDFVPVP